MTLHLLATGYPSLDLILPVSHSPAVGETALLRALPDDTAMTYGGCGLNAAVALAKLGARAGAAVVLGDDPAGRRYLAYLREQGVDTTNVILLPGAQTSRSYLFRSPAGEYQNFFFPGAADDWDGTLTLQNVAQARYALVTVGAYRYNRQFVERVREVETPLVWQLKPDIFAFPVEAMRDFAAAGAFILMNHIEAQFISKALGLRVPEALLNNTTQVLVITRGAAGCEVYMHGGKVAVPAVPPTRLVDTTGAGDAFTAGFLAGLIRGCDMQICARIGSVVASFVLEAIGCQTNLPDWERMEGRYMEHFGKPSGIL
jgi:sugar/nucleoside kinase (ribokinase family)